MRSDFEQRKEHRIENLEERAEKKARESESRLNRARDSIAGIPPGQPILVGHHSEQRHRNALKRHDQNMRKGIDAGDKAAELRGRAAAAESNTAIFSDDPEAVTKLKEEIASLEDAQKQMRDFNKAWRKAGKPAPDDTEGWRKVADLTGRADNDLHRIRADMARDPLNRGPFPDYALSNNNANLRRVKARLVELEALEQSQAVEIEGDGWTYFESPEDNRLGFYFDGKPSESVRKLLKSRGFRWARSLGRWQRHLTNGRGVAAWVREELAKIGTEQ